MRNKKPRALAVTDFDNIFSKIIFGVGELALHYITNGDVSREPILRALGPNLGRGYRPWMAATQFSKEVIMP